MPGASTINRTTRNALGICIPTIQGILASKARLRRLRPALDSTAAALGWSRAVLRDVWAILTEGGARVATALEDTIRERVCHSARPSNRGASETRARLVARQLTPFVRGQSVLDVGCGDGLVALRLLASCHVSMRDVLDYRSREVRANRVPFELMSGELDLGRGTDVDTVVLATVLHHSDDPVGLLRASSRVARRSIVVIESVFGSGLRSGGRWGDFGSWPRTRQLDHVVFFDWLHNRIVNPGVRLSYNYNTVAGWSRVFSSLSISTKSVIHLGVDVRSVPEYHVLFHLVPATQFPSAPRPRHRR